MKKLFIITLIVLQLLSLAACNMTTQSTSTESTSADETISMGEGIDKIIADAGVLEKPDTTKCVSEIKNFQSNEITLWLGSIIKGCDLENKEYTPINIDRAPFSYSISLEGQPSKGSLVNTVDAPSLGNVRDAVSKHLSEIVTEDTSVAADVAFDYEQVYSEKEMSLYVNASGSYGGFETKASFDWSKDNKKNLIIASYKQVYYTLDIEMPSSPSEFYKSTIDSDKLKNAMPEGTKPVYVSSVTYGVVAYAFIETEYTKEQIKAALEAKYSGMGGSVDAQTGVSYDKMVSEASIKTYVYGGSTEGIKDLEKGYDGFKNAIEQSRNWGPDSLGAPIAYSIRNLADNTKAYVEAARFPVYKITLGDMTCTYALDADHDSDPTRKIVEMDTFVFNMTSYLDTDVKSEEGEQNLKEWRLGGRDDYRTAVEGQIFYIEENKAGEVYLKESKTVIFSPNAVVYDINDMYIELVGISREYDGRGHKHDEGISTWRITGDEFPTTLNKKKVFLFDLTGETNPDDEKIAKVHQLTFQVKVYITLIEE